MFIEVFRALASRQRMFGEMQLARECPPNPTDIITWVAFQRSEPTIISTFGAAHGDARRQPHQKDLIAPSRCASAWRRNCWT